MSDSNQIFPTLTPGERARLEAALSSVTLICPKACVRKLLADYDAVRKEAEGLLADYDAARKEAEESLYSE